MPSVRAAAKRPQKHVASIVIGCRLLEILEAESRMMTLTEIAKRARMSPSKAHAYLASFIASGMVMQDAERGLYALGALAMRLGAAAMRQSDLIGLAREAISDLRERTGCTVFLSIWGNRGPTIVHKIDGRWTLLPMQVGFVLPVIGSATGNAFLAYLPEDDTRVLVANELAAVKGRKALVEAIVRSVRRNGFAGMKTSQLYAGVAAPIRRHDGTIAGALTISRPSEVIDTKTRRVLGMAALAGAKVVSERLGYRQDATG